jgi:hypothetical protein
MSSRVVEQCTGDIQNHASKRLLYNIQSMGVMRQFGLGDVTGFTLRLCALIVGGGRCRDVVVTRP